MPTGADSLGRAGSVGGAGAVAVVLVVVVTGGVSAGGTGVVVVVVVGGSTVVSVVTCTTPGGGATGGLGMGLTGGGRSTYDGRRMHAPGGRPFRGEAPVCARCGGGRGGR